MPLKLTLAYSLLFSMLLLLPSCEQDRERQEQIDSRLQEIAQVKDPAKIAELAQQQFEAAEKINYRKGMANADFFLGRANYKSGNYKLALQHHLQALETRRHLEDKAGTAESYTALGNIYYYLALYPEALEYYQKSLEANQQLGKTKELADVYSNLGLVYRDMKQWEKAKRNFEDALVLYQQLNDRENISWVYNDLGINQELEAQETGQADYARILSWYKEAMQLNEALQAKQGLGWVYNNVGRMYCKLNQPVQALEYLQKAEPLLKEAQDYPNLVIMYTRKGEAYRQLGKFTEALELLKKAEQLEGKVAGSDKEKIGETYKVLQEVYAALQDQAKVRLYQEKEQALAQQVAQIREKGQVAHLQNQIIADQAEKFFFVRALSYANGENLRKQVMLVATITIAVLLLIALIGSIFYLVRLTRKTAVLEEFVFIISGGKTQNRRMRK